MNQLETNVMNSFRLAKSDIIHNNMNITELLKTQKQLVRIVTELRLKQLQFGKLNSKVKAKPVRHKHRKNYVAAKGAKKFHLKSCPFAKNIHPKNTMKFALKNTALNHGLKPCKCVE